MIFGMTNEDRAKSQIWFAWRPVQLASGRWVWWEKIRRRKYGYRGDLRQEYRLMGDKNE